MPALASQETVVQKTRELCQTILDAPGMREVRQRIDTFLSDEGAKALYEKVMLRGQTLQDKRRNSLPLSGEEITAFETERDALMANPVARGFLDAQDELHHLQESVHQYLTKTLELGRMPADGDFEHGDCGHGCGCSH